MKLYPFSALLARMKYITRWSLMHSTYMSDHLMLTSVIGAVVIGIGCGIVVRSRDVYKRQAVGLVTFLRPDLTGDERECVGNNREVVKIGRASCRARV